MKSTLLILIGLLLFSACKKVERVLLLEIPAAYVGVYDTIYPLSYLPAYPGSNWDYINQNNDTSSRVSGADYVLDSYEVSP